MSTLLTWMQDPRTIPIPLVFVFRVQEHWKMQESVQNGGISYGYLNLWDENVKLNYEASGASSVFTITYKCSFSINTIPYDTSEPTSSDASKYFQPASFDTSYPIAYSIEKDIKIIVNDINEAPSITFQLAGLDGNGKMNETAAQNFIVANFACANDPEMERCGGCSGMTYGCSGNGFHTSWGQQNCGDVVRAFAITGQNLVVAKPLLLDYEMLYTSLGASNLAVTVRIINDGHGQCEGVSGGPSGIMFDSPFLSDGSQPLRGVVLSYFILS